MNHLYTLSVDFSMGRNVCCSMRMWFEMECESAEKKNKKKN